MAYFADYPNLDFTNLNAVTSFRDSAVGNNLILDAGFFTNAVSSLSNGTTDRTSSSQYLDTRAVRETYKAIHQIMQSCVTY